MAALFRFRSADIHTTVIVAGIVYSVLVSTPPTASSAIQVVAVTNQSAPGGGTFTGWRWENRVRPLKREHAVNPVIYLEYESISEASRIQKEVVGSGALSFDEGIAHLRQEHARELEGKLILSSTVRGWNVAKNVIVEKNLSEAEGFEWGYAVGVSRHVRDLPLASGCLFCRIVIGVEAYGGLGSTQDRGLSDTRHYVAPVLAWRTKGTLKVSAGFGLTEASDRALIRVGYVCELGKL